MKRILFLCLLMLSCSTFAQKMPEECNEMPYAKVDQKAELTSNTEKQLKVTVPADMKKGEFNASVKCYVTCEGTLESISYHKGDFSEDQQEWLIDVINDSEWKAAVKEDVYVKSTVFLQVEMKNGQVKLTVF